MRSTDILWINLDRNGVPIPVDKLPPRDPEGPPLKNGSPYTPDFLVDDHLPVAHLHHKDGRIIGIRMEGELELARNWLGIALRYEQQIIDNFADQHHFDIPLAEAMEMVMLWMARDIDCANHHRRMIERCRRADKLPELNDVVRNAEITCALMDRQKAAEDTQAQA